jgi:glycosyltransferase involved in cell wall biosynthesis
MKIVFAAPLYPPDIGGPSQYAKQLHDEFVKKGYQVTVVAYGARERMLPVLIRHIYYFYRLLRAGSGTDAVLAFDAWSVGLSAFLASKLLSIKLVIRLAGDQVWETYVQDSGHMLTLREFSQALPALSLKLRIMRAVVRFVLLHADTVFFPSEWFKEICVSSYGLQSIGTAVIENCRDVPAAGEEPRRKNYLFAGRQILLKNGALLHRAFVKASQKRPEIVLEEGVFKHEEYIERLRSCYCLVVPSLSETVSISILEGMRYGKPFIGSKESGLYEELKEIGIFIDPHSEKELEDAILALADDSTYREYVRKIRIYSRIRTYAQIGDEILDLLK